MNDVFRWHLEFEGVLNFAVFRRLEVNRGGKNLIIPSSFPLPLSPSGPLLLAFSWHARAHIHIHTLTNKQTSQEVTG